jgi:hypothetical protein
MERLEIGIDTNSVEDDADVVAGEFDPMDIPALTVGARDTVAEEVDHWKYKSV